MSNLQSQIQSNIEAELNLEKWVTMGGPKSGHWGHKGRPGMRGGSAPSKGLGKLSAPVGNIGEGGNKVVSDWFNDATGDYAEPPALTWENAPEKIRSRLKAQVARDLARASGVTEQEAANFVRQWAHSSNGDDMRSLAIQQDAAKEFGVKTSEFTEGKIQQNREKAMRLRDIEGVPSLIQRETAKVNPLMESDKQRTVLRAMYNETQAELKARGITEVRLYRGVVLNDIDYKRVESAGFTNAPMDTNAIESWSVSLTTARMFTRGRPATGVVFETLVPAERILATPATGFGCLTEGEVVVLGGIDGDRGDVT